MPAPWLAVLERDVEPYRIMPAALRERLCADIRVFLDEKRFVGQHGLEVDTRMQVIIAAYACLLQLNQHTKYYPDFTTIIVYPDTFVATATERDGMLESTVVHARAGESWFRGPMVLSWADIREDLEHPGDGGNVIVHEFAHKLDEQDGLVDGAPELAAAQRGSWPAIFQREYERLCRRVEHGTATLLDPYAATAPEEFFAVAVETFFTRATAMRSAHPELYAELQRYFALDPAGWCNAA